MDIIRIIKTIETFFAKDWSGAAFEFLGTVHLITLGLIILLNLYLLSFRYKPDKIHKRIRRRIAIILILNELGWHAWNYFIGEWTIQTMLPLHLCSVLVWISAFMLLTENYFLYEFVFFLGIAGALQALLTPDLGIYGFPHYRFFQTFISHGLIFTAAIYMTTVEGLRPTWKSILRVAIWINVYMAIVFFVNQAIGSNYLFIAHKPPTASILDMLPPWPIYIAYMEAIGLACVLLLYLPFAIKDWRDKRIMSKGSIDRLDDILK